jgi:hypothetical protein
MGATPASAVVRVSGWVTGANPASVRAAVTAMDLVKVPGRVQVPAMAMDPARVQVPAMATEPVKARDQVRVWVPATDPGQGMDRDPLQDPAKVRVPATAPGRAMDRDRVLRTDPVVIRAPELDR